MILMRIIGSEALIMNSQLYTVIITFINGTLDSVCSTRLTTHEVEHDGSKVMI